MIVQNILNYIEPNDISISEFARKCELRPTTIFSIVNGKTRSPTLDVVEKIAKGMGLTIDELTKNDRQANTEIQKMYDEMKELDDRERAIIRAMITSATKAMKEFREE